MTEDELDAQAQMTYDVLIETLRRLDRERRIVLVHPDQVERVRDAVTALPIEYLPGLIEVRPSRFVELDELICFRPPSWMAQQPIYEFTPPSCVECRGVDSHKMDCSTRRRRWEGWRP